MTHVLKIENLQVAVEGKPILRGVDLEIKHGETHALMGPNGSGKSTLGQAIMGHPKYEVTGGTITLDGEDLLEMETLPIRVADDAMMVVDESAQQVRCAMDWKDLPAFEQLVAGRLAGI